MNYLVSFSPFIVLLLILFIARLIRQQKAKNILSKNEDKTKMYIDNGKTIDDGIIVRTLNGKKPDIGRDNNGNYVILNVGTNTISASFRALKDFATGFALGSVSGIMPIKEFDGDITCLAESDIIYKLEFNMEKRNFEVIPLFSI